MNHRTITSLALAGAAGMLLLTDFLEAGVEPGRRAAANQKTSAIYAKKAVQGFDMKLWISNQMTIGQESWDGLITAQSPPYGLEYPVASGVEHIYGAGPWIGGILNGEAHVSEGYNGNNGSKYILPDIKHPLRELIWVTSIDSLNHPNRRECDDDGDGRTDEDDLNGRDDDGDWELATMDVGADGIPDSLETGCKGGYDAATNPDPAFDNYNRSSIDYCHPDAQGNYRRQSDPDMYTEKNQIPDHGEPNVDEDFAALSNNDLYCSARDDNQPAVGHFPMKIEVVQKSYAWSGKFAEGIILFEYLFISRNDSVIRDAYVGFFADMDVGPVDNPNYPGNCYSCYIPESRTAYIHNPIDRGSTPSGLTILGTPKPLDSLDFIFQWFNFTTRVIPDQSDSTLYSWMSGRANPDLVAQCESPTAPSDTRFLFSFGPFDELKKNDTLKITVAVVVGKAVSNGADNITERAEKAVKLYQGGISVPKQLSRPVIHLKQETDKRALTVSWSGSEAAVNPYDVWDESSILAGLFPNDDWRRVNPPCTVDSSTPGNCTGTGSGMCDSSGSLPGGRTFEGYRLYRNETPAPETTPDDANWVLLKEYDIVDGYGYDSGMDSVYVDSNLTRGKRYWYTVTSFAIPDVAFLEQPGGGEVPVYTPGQESPKTEWVYTDNPFSASDKLNEVMVVPNPYRVDADYTFENGGWEGRSTDWDEAKRKIKFIHLPRKCTIRVFTLTGEQIADIEYDAQQRYEAKLSDTPDAGELDFELLSEARRALASGVYIFTVESEFGRQIGKFALIR